MHEYLFEPEVAPVQLDQLFVMVKPRQTMAVLKMMQQRKLEFFAPAHVVHTRSKYHAAQSRSTRVVLQIISQTAMPVRGRDQHDGPCVGYAIKQNFIIGMCVA